MLKSTHRTISAIVVAACVAAALAVVPGISEQVSANAPLNSGKGDRLDIRVTGAKCSEQAWPYYEAGCLKDRRQAMSQAKPVRIITTDRGIEMSASKRAGK